MAYLSVKEEYLKFKGFPELMTPLQSGDSDTIVKVKSGTVVEVNADTVAVLAEIAPEFCKGFKNEINTTKLAWLITDKAEKKFMKDTIKVSRLEKTLYQHFKQKIGTWFSGEIFVSCTSLLFQQFEAGSDTALQSLVALDMKNTAPTFNVPAASGNSGNKGGNNYAPKENEILKQRMDFVLSVVAQSGDFGQNVVPSVIELAVWATSGINSVPNPGDRALSINSLVFLLWFGMNLSGATVPIEDIRKIVGGNFSQ